MIIRRPHFLHRVHMGYVVPAKTNLLWKLWNVRTIPIQWLYSPHTALSVLIRINHSLVYLTWQIIGIAIVFNQHCVVIWQKRYILYKPGHNMSQRHWTSEIHWSEIHQIIAFKTFHPFNEVSTYHEKGWRHFFLVSLSLFPSHSELS